MINGWENFTAKTSLKIGLEIAKRLPLLAQKYLFDGMYFFDSLPK